MARTNTSKVENSSGSFINPATEEKQDTLIANQSNVDLFFKIQQAINEVQDSYGDTVSVDQKMKNLRKWGENENVGTAGATIMTLGGTETEETFVSANSITTVISDNGADTMDIDFYEGHDWNSGNTLFVKEDTNTTLTGTTAKALPTGLARTTRARLTQPCTGNIYFYEGGATTSGVPNDKTTIHMIIPAGEIQTQKASTTISSQDYWFITGGKATVLEKTSSWAQIRIEIKPVSSTYFYPVTEWIGVSDASGSRPLLDPDDPIIVVPKNHDVRIFAKSNTAGVHVAGGITGYLASIIS